MHPFQTYHHAIVHSNFSGECAACPHTHPELQHQIYFVAAISLAFLFLRKS